VRLLLDTHALIWWAAGDTSLSLSSRRALDDDANDVFVSAASAWEIAIKHRSGKLPHAGLLVTDVAGFVAEQGFAELPISIGDAERAGRLPLLHKDPFDRMLIAQAIAHELAIVSNETLFDAYGIARFW